MRELRTARAQTAAAIGLSSSHVGGLQAAARKPAQPPRGAHGDRRRQMLTLAEEQQFLRPWGERAASAGMVIVPPLHAALEQQLGRKIHPSQVYRLLARHGWRKLAPDSVHPKADLGKQEDWKKNSRRWWQKSWPALKLKEKDQD